MNFTQRRQGVKLGANGRQRRRAAAGKGKPMADRNKKGPGNAPGRYYVDDTCIDCDFCRSLAPRVFARDGERGSSYVHRQPATPEEVAEAEEARASCPTDTIGNDG